MQQCLPLLVTSSRRLPNINHCPVGGAIVVNVEPGAGSVFRRELINGAVGDGGRVTSRCRDEVPFLVGAIVLSPNLHLGSVGGPFRIYVQAAGGGIFRRELERAVRLEGRDPMFVGRAVIDMDVRLGPVGGTARDEAEPAPGGEIHEVSVGGEYRRRGQQAEFQIRRAGKLKIARARITKVGRRQRAAARDIITLRRVRGRDVVSDIRARGSRVDICPAIGIIV